MRRVSRFKDASSRVTRTVLAVLMITVTLTSQLLLVSGAGAAGSSGYRMTATVTNLIVCIGREKQIQVGVSLELPENEVADEESPNLHIPGHEVAADVTPSNVITVSPYKTTTGPDPGNRPTFTITGKRVGEAVIKFSHLFREWEGYIPFIRAAPRAPAVEVHVTVRPCYEAYASSLEEVWTENYMGALDEPFKLAGSVDTGGMTGRSSRMYFAPVSRNDFDGVFIMIEYVEYFGFPCTVFTGGSYNVVFYEGGGKRYGDLITEGSATQVCDGMVTSTQNLALRIAFRSTLPEGQ